MSQQGRRTTVARVTDKRLIDIETKLAHQEQLLGELNDVVTNQQAQITKLEHLCSSLIERLRSLSDGEPDPGAADERPPHY